MAGAHRNPTPPGDSNSPSNSNHASHPSRTSTSSRRRISSKGSNSSNRDKSSSSQGDGFSKEFDASKQAKAPNAAFYHAPKNLPAVEVGIVKGIGFGLFAARDFLKGEFIFEERPAVVTDFIKRRELNVLHEEAQYDKLMHAYETCPAIRAAFPGLFANLGMAPLDYDEFMNVIGHLDRNIVDGRGRLVPPVSSQADQVEGEAPQNPVEAHQINQDADRMDDQDGHQITEETYNNFIAQFGAFPGKKPPPKELHRAAANFLRGYAFLEESQADLKPKEQAVRAQIYLLGSLMNHCCRPPIDKETGQSPTEDADGNPVGPNCTWRIGPQGLAKFALPGDIVVEARRDIHKGEELTWDYGKKDKLGFVCLCRTCVPAPGSIKGWCHVM